MPSEGDLRGLAEGVHLSGEIYWGGHMTPYSRARCPQNCRGGCDMHGIHFGRPLVLFDNRSVCCSIVSK